MALCNSALGCFVIIPRSAISTLGFKARLKMRWYSLDMGNKPPTSPLPPAFSTLLCGWREPDPNDRFQDLNLNLDVQICQGSWRGIRRVESEVIQMKGLKGLFQHQASFCWAGAMRRLPCSCPVYQDCVHCPLKYISDLQPLLQSILLNLEGFLGPAYLPPPFLGNKWFALW